MTMQGQDYIRISRALHDTRLATLNGLPTTDTTTRNVVRAAYRDIAIALARGFVSVNSRFHADRFLFDILGEKDGRLALAHFRATEPSWVND